MNKISQVAFFFVIGFTFSCNGNNSRTPILKEYQRKSTRTTKHSSGATVFRFYNEKYMATFLSYEDHKKVQRVIFGKLLGKTYGHYFIFDDKFQLKKYKFDVGDNKHHSYEISNINDGYFEIGNPFVDFWKDESYPSQDSTLYILFFSKFPRTKVRAFYSNDSLRFQQLSLVESSVMPFLLESKLILPNKKQTSIKFKIEAQHLFYGLKELQDKKIFFNSANLNAD
jgi:hypothetical protein